MSPVLLSHSPIPTPLNLLKIPDYFPILPSLVLYSQSIQSMHFVFNEYSVSLHTEQILDFSL